MRTEWVYCPICKNKTRIKLREDTQMKNFLLFCPKCKQECLINVERLHITVSEQYKKQVNSLPACKQDK